MKTPKHSSLKKTLEEQSLLSKLAEGDRDAFWKIWNTYRDYLYSRCRTWMGGNHFDAEEYYRGVVAF